jgi:hypothetical protein
MGNLTKKEKIVCCIGNVNLKSAAILCNTSASYVSNVWSDFGYNYKREKKRYNAFGYKN